MRVISSNNAARFSENIHCLNTDTTIVYHCLQNKAVTSVINTLKPSGIYMYHPR
jgi:hypothetical protein